MTKDLEVAILFADVVGSTQLYDKFGDTKASQTVADCLEVMKEATHECDGTVIKTIGDEVMSTFPTVENAMDAAVNMQARISTESQQPGPGSRYRFASVATSGRWCRSRTISSVPPCTRPTA